jgi:hypothetical protein
MKKFIIGTGLALGLILTSFTVSNVSPIESEKASIGCHYGQCQATAKSTGNQCKHCVSNEGDYYCWQHD